MSETKSKSSKRVSRKVLKKRLNLAKIVFYIGAIVLVVGLILGLVTNIRRYPNGDRKMFEVTIVNSKQQTDIEEQENAVVSVVKYHLVGDATYKGSEHMITLDEAYSTKAFADSKIGEKRRIAVETNTFTEIQKKPFNWFFVIPVVTGIVLMFGTFLYAYRYSNVFPMFIRLPEKKRNSQKSKQSEKKVTMKPVEKKELTADKINNESDESEEDAYIDALLDSAESNE